MSQKNMDDDAAHSISGADVVRFVRTQFWWIAGFLVLGAVAGVAVSFASPREWEATSVLQVGQVDDGPTTASGAPTPIAIDTPQRAVERVKVRSFEDGVLQALGIPVDDRSDSRASLIRKTLQAKPVPDTDLFTISAHGFSPEQAKAIVQAAQIRLIAERQPFVTDALQRLHDRMNELNKEIADARSKRDRMGGVAVIPRAQAQAGGNQAVADSLLGNMADVSSATLLADAERRRDDINRALSPDHTFNTKPLGGIALSDFPVSPKRSVFAMLGALLGLLIGLLVASMRSSRR